MTIKNTLIGVMGIGLVAGSSSLAASVTIEVDGQDFLSATNITYAHSGSRIYIDSQYGWVDLDPNHPCVADVQPGNLELWLLGPNGQTLQFLVDEATYLPASKTLKLNTTTGSAGNCRTEVLYWSRFESVDPGPTPGS